MKVVLNKPHIKTIAPSDQPLLKGLLGLAT